uniref:Stork_head domain-containing protein n=1 Tax=Steinernema glaseri TaxID=37863 RepID=A0A1I8A184_9BILA
MTLNVSSKCLAIVFEPVDASRRMRSSKNGHKMFASFVEENKLSFWNRDLVSAVCALEYVGFMRPSTLFVSCKTNQHLEVLRTSWSRRILKPAAGFSILSFGDMGGIQIDRVEQAQFVPLADVICDVIAQLNRLGQAATNETLSTEIRIRFAGVAPPTNDMIAQTLSSLIRTGLVYQMGKHLFVSVPAASVAQEKPSYPYHAALTAAPQSCTVECQTGKSIINEEISTKSEQEAANGNGAKSKAPKRGIFARLFARKENVSSPGNSKKTESDGKSPVVFSAQFPPSTWISNNKENNNVVVEDINTKRFYTVPENLCRNQNIYDDDETTEADTYINVREPPARRHNEHRRNKDKRRSRRYYISSSSECLNYGPIDPPEYLPPYEAEIIEQIKPERINAKHRRRTAHVPSSRLPVRTSTPIHAEIPTSRRPGSDSAYSASPVMPEDEESTTFFAKASSSSWSDQVVAQTAFDGIDEDSECNQHTYVNLGPIQFDSTQFEEITQIENTCSKQAATVEPRADTRNIFPVNL